MRLGIVGSGGIVEECLKALIELTAIERAAICARPSSEYKAVTLAAEYRIGAVYTDYDMMLAHAAIDTVYVGIINSLHFEYARRALESGKSVIVEKPFTSTYAEAEALASLARERRLFLFEAVTLMHSPVVKFALESLGSIGDVRLVQCNYSQYSSRYDAYLAGNALPVFDPALSGGALYDLNVYNLHFATTLLGRPDVVEYRANIGFNGVDTSGVATLRYPGSVAVCVGAKDSASPGFAMVQGTKGHIRIDGAPNVSTSIECVAGGATSRRADDYAGHRMVHEFRAFEAMMSEGLLDECYAYLEHSLVVMDVLTRARASAGIAFLADAHPIA